MTKKEKIHLAPEQEPANVEWYFPWESSADPDFALPADRNDGRHSWLTRILGWLVSL